MLSIVSEHWRRTGHDAIRRGLLRGSRAVIVPVGTSFLARFCLEPAKGGLVRLLVQGSFRSPGLAFTACRANRSRHYGLQYSARDKISFASYSSLGASFAQSQFAGVVIGGL